MMNSQFSQNFQIQDTYSIFQVRQQEEEPMNLDRSTKNFTRSENYFSQSLNRLEAQMIRLINIAKDKNEETLLNTCSTIPNCPRLMKIKNYGVLETLTKSQVHHTNLNLTNSKPWINW